MAGRSAARAACKLEAHGALEHGEEVDDERVGERERDEAEREDGVPG